MALINCPECGNAISNYADVCPHCGCPISIYEDDPTPNINQFAKYKTINDSQAEIIKRSNKRLVLEIVALVVLFFAIVAMLYLAFVHLGGRISFDNGSIIFPAVTVEETVNENNPSTNSTVEKRS